MSKGWLAFCLLCAAASAAVGQESRVPDLLTAARRLVAAQQLDSAQLLLEQAADSSAGGTEAQRAQAFVLLGIVLHYQDRDSLTAAAFRAALVLDAKLRIGGSIDSSLARMLESERARLASASRRLHYCIPKCRDGEQSPKLLNIPSFPTYMNGGPDFMNPHAIVLVQVIVSANGIPEPESVRVVSSTRWSLNSQVLDAVRAAHFLPALANGVAIRALVELSFDFRAEGLGAVTSSIRGP